MKVVYIAGPYRAESEIAVFDNINIARSYAETVWRLGFVALCPHLNSAFMGGLVSDEVFLAGGIELMRRADAVLVISGERSDKSEGTRAEIAEAKRLRMPVYYSFGALKEEIGE